METFQTKGYPCPHCGKQLDAAESFNDDTPRPPSEGDFTVCAYCQNWLVFENDHELREITESEITALPDELFELLSKTSKLMKEFADEQKKGKI